MTVRLLRALTNTQSCVPGRDRWQMQELDEEAEITRIADTNDESHDRKCVRTPRWETGMGFIAISKARA